MNRLHDRVGPPPVSPFTRQEERIAQHLEFGSSSKTIAKDLGCEESTVEKHRSNMAKKVDVSGSGALMRWLIRRRQQSITLPNVSKNVLTGYWLSRFSFQSLDRNSRPDVPKFVNGAQINLEMIEPADGIFNYAGQNVCGARRPLGTVYKHRLQFLVKHRMAVGIWDNGDNTDNVGCFQLFIYSDARMMAGHHLGNSSNGAVKSGDWVWIKLMESPGFKVPSERMRAYSELDALVERFLNGGAAPAVADLFS
jgi:DNA-binding CsgD family transcriptional regulator